MKKGEILKNISIEKLGYGGVGIGKLENGKVVMIKGGLPGSIVDCKVIRNKSDYILAHIVEVEKVDKQLVSEKPRCPHFMSPYTEGSGVAKHKQGCGGCKWQGVSYDKQCEMKEKVVFDAFQILDNDRFELYPILPSPKEFGYRNKIEFSFGKYLRKHKPGYQPKKGESAFAIEEHWNVGFHKQGEFSKVIEVDQCYLVSEKMHAVYERIKHDLEKSGLPVYDVKTRKGLLRHLVIREGSRTGQLMVNISIATKFFDKNPNQRITREKLLDFWQKNEDLFTLISTLVVTENNDKADNVQGPSSSTDVKWGEGHIFEGLQFDNVDLLRFQVSPFSFFQTNTLGAEVLFDRAKDMIGKVHGNIIDLYCGSGSIGLSFLHQGLGKELHGIEVVPESIEDARKNAKVNGLHDKATFYAGKAENLLKEGVIDDTCFVGNDLLIVDPPRKGLHKDVIDFLKKIKKRFSDHILLYISCNPTTMARDVQRLEDSYNLQALQPVDMFPQTHHIEIIGVLR